MKSRTGRIVTLTIVVAAAAVGFVFAGNLGSEEEKRKKQAPATGRGTTTNTTPESVPEPRPKTIVVRDAKPVGGVPSITAEQGERVRFVVRSDVSDGIHVHGYDIEKHVDAGGSVSFNFPAKIGGVFEVELEDRGVQIASLRVEP
jgi:hypothetical protein